MTAAPADPPAPPAKKPLKQYNVRLPEDLVDLIETRRKAKRGRDGKPLSQSAWTERALRFALQNAPQQQNPSNGRTRSRPARRPTTPST